MVYEKWRDLMKKLSESYLKKCFIGFLSVTMVLIIIQLYLSVKNHVFVFTISVILLSIMLGVGCYLLLYILRKWMVNNHYLTIDSIEYTSDFKKTESYKKLIKISGIITSFSALGGVTGHLIYRYIDDDSDKFDEIKIIIILIGILASFFILGITATINQLKEKLYIDMRMINATSDEVLKDKIISFCFTPKTKQQISAHIGDHSKLAKTDELIDDLILNGRIKCIGSDEKGLPMYYTM